MVAWHLLLDSSLPHFLVKSSEAADIPFQGIIQVLQHTQECPFTHCRLCSSFTLTGQHATQPAGHRQGTGACMHTYVLHIHLGVLYSQRHTYSLHSHVGMLSTVTYMCTQPGLWAPER